MIASASDWLDILFKLVFLAPFAFVTGVVMLIVGLCVHKRGLYLVGLGLMILSPVVLTVALRLVSDLW